MATDIMRRGRVPVSLSAFALCVLVSGCNNREPNAAGDAYCDAISDYTSTDNCTDFQKQADREVDGTAAVNAPNPMNRGDTVNLSLAIAADQPKPQPVSLPVNGPPPWRGREPDNIARKQSAPPPPPSPVVAGPAPTAASPTPAATATYAPTPSEVVAPMPGHTDVFGLTVGEHVKAVLDGDEGFKITPRSPATQRVHLGAPYPATLWNWDVTAVHGGTHTLRINTIVQAIDRNGQYHDLVGSPHAYAFTVKVGFWGNVQDKMQLAPTWIKLITGVIVALTALVAAVSKLRNAVLEALGIKRKVTTD